ncbi:MAG TPA: insulinase family protein [Acholeplasmataceae bacterium]|nr:insulinase family protein [Acholeplasmataceae bacterium]
MEIFEINGIETVLIKTDKFKTITFFITYLGEYNKEVATAKTLLSMLLSGSTKNYQTKKAILNKLFSLYDAAISVHNFPIYKTNVQLFALNIINPKFVQNENLLTESIEFLKEFIFNPNIDNEGFTENEFNEKKRILRDNINSIYNNKGLYAFRRLMQEMGKDEIISVNPMGTLEDLEKITRSDIYDEYQKMINDEQIKIYVIGDIEKESIIENLKDFTFKKNGFDLQTVSYERKTIEKTNEVFETQNVNQAKLMMGFRTNVNALDDLYVPMTVFNMMFGGMGSSDLFRVVREENSLAYTVSSSVFFDTCIMVVSAGIDSKDYELTTDLIIKQLEKYKQGHVDENLMVIAKENLISNINQTVDDPYANLNFVLKNNLLNNLTAEQLVEAIKNVTKEDIIKASQKIELDTIYCLKGEANG